MGADRGISWQAFEAASVDSVAELAYRGCAYDKPATIAALPAVGIVGLALDAVEYLTRHTCAYVNSHKAACLTDCADKIVDVA